VTYRVIQAELKIDWAHDNDELSLVDESARLISASGSSRLAPPYQSITGTSGQIPTASFVLDNADNRYSALVASSPLYSEISGGKMYRVPVRFRVSVDGGATFITIFRGVAKLPKVATLTTEQGQTISLDCRGNLEKILNVRVSASQSDFATWFDGGYTEGDIIDHILGTYVGMSDVTDYTVEAGAFQIRNVPADNESAVELCWRLAAATGGRFHVNKGGRIMYWNWTAFLRDPAAVTSQATLDRSTFAGFASYYDDRDLASKVIVTGSLPETGDSGTVWHAREALLVPPGQTRSIEAKWGGGLYSITGVTYRAASAGGTDLTSSIALTRTDYAQRMTLSFANSHATLQAIITKLAITGVTVEAEDFTEEATTVNTFWGGPTRPGNSLVQRVNSDYIQSPAQAASLAAFVLGRQELPVLFYDIKGAPGNPDLDLGQRITIDDSQTMDDARDAFIIGLRWQYGADTGFRQDIEAIDTAALYPYIDATPGYFRIGVGGNTLGTGSASPGRIFY